MTPDISIHVTSWIGLFAALGFLAPSLIASAAGGYILCGFVIKHIARTVLGTHIRHFFTNIAPAKRFDPTDRERVIAIIRRAIADGHLGLEDRIS